MSVAPACNQDVDPTQLINTLGARMPDIIRWCGAVARQLRKHDVAVADKGTGYAPADALTLADLSIQEILVDALRDFGPQFHRCRLEVEEDTGDTSAFASESPYTIAIDPIDGTKHFRDRTSDGYGILISLRRADASLYSLAFFPEQGRVGEWVEVNGDRIVHALDDTSMPARHVLDAAPGLDAHAVGRSNTIWVTGYRTNRTVVGKHLAREGLAVVMSDSYSDHVCTELAKGRVDGMLMNRPGVYDAPMWMHVLAALSGVACWAHNRERVDFRDVWYDENTRTQRLSGVVACARDEDQLARLVAVAERCMLVEHSD